MRAAVSAQGLMVEEVVAVEGTMVRDPAGGAGSGEGGGGGKGEGKRRGEERGRRKGIERGE